MPKFAYKKLVRDKIVEDQIATGAVPRYRILKGDEHKTALVHKIMEEARELLDANPAEVVAEMADVQQALDDLKECYGLTDAEVAAAARVKNDKKGAFKKGFYIESVEVPENSEWVTYYRRNAERYPEL
jgi:predicted house-cleaning noncanonical NTP pyrophosphatase (MazG superfamily)